MTSGGISTVLPDGQMAGNAGSRERFAERRIYRNYVKCGNMLFQFGEEDCDELGNGLPEFCSFLNFIKTVTR